MPARRCCWWRWLGQQVVHLAHDVVERVLAVAGVDLGDAPIAADHHHERQAIDLVRLADAVVGRVVSQHDVEVLPTAPKVLELVVLVVVVHADDGEVLGSFELLQRRQHR